MRWVKIDDYVDEFGYRILIFKRGQATSDGVEWVMAQVMPPKNN